MKFSFVPTMSEWSEKVCLSSLALNEWLSGPHLPTLLSPGNRRTADKLYPENKPQTLNVSLGLLGRTKAEHGGPLSTGKGLRFGKELPPILWPLWEDPAVTARTLDRVS